ncbi:MAG TPA: hypothetical protein EYN18_01215 [Nitrospirales bacterium]|nr:hypothetical protein [Nitrospirales bacterium]HIB53574.1 hypothetical protein [Nitrospirales bacterium]HIC04491.1 hypothetical protein [Nitrospirales bacterium]HIO21005.1 hypothetical protein [Nitrospirales bacterium]HIO69860.1 hypothetical protein [Nitrospirales bacterium]
MPPSIHPIDLIRTLKSKQLTPAIVFLTSRRSCDNALEAFTHIPPTLSPKRQATISRLIDQWTVTYPSIQNHPLRERVIQYGVAAHHAGHLPSWKIVIEELMREGVLDAVFATTTLAAGVDFPARTVIITQSNIRKSQGFVDLTVAEVQQIAGRAGRRGKDQVGFAIVTPSPYIDLVRLTEGLTGCPEPLRSQFEISYSMVLNLLKAYPQDHIQTILDKSFAQFQLNTKAETLQTTIDTLEASLADYAPRPCADWIHQWQSFQQTVLDTTKRLRPRGDSPPELAARIPYLIPGQVVSMSKRRVVVMHLYRTRGKNNPMITAMRFDGTIAHYPVSAIKKIIDATVPLPTGRHGKGAVSNQARALPTKLQPLAPHIPAITPDVNPHLIDTLTPDMFQTLSEHFPCPTCPSQHTCGVEFATGHADRTKLHHHIDSIQQLQTGLWRTFQKRMNVLQHLGYLTSANQLTEVGEWARYIRISPSLLVTELIRTDVLAGMDPPVLAGVMASIAFDDDRPAVFPRISQALAGRLTHVRQLARSLEAYEEPPLLRADVAALPERWIGDPTMRWADLCKGTSMAEGDIYRLLARNLEYLSQIRFLSATHPLLAATATQAIQIMQREVLEELP